MKRYIKIEIDSISENAINWTVECLRGGVRDQERWRRKDTDDPNICIEITKIEGGE
jgi:hypothetical protein